MSRPRIYTPEEIRERKRMRGIEYRKRNREKIRAYKKRPEVRERRKAENRRWREKNPDYQREYYAFSADCDAGAVVCNRDGRGFDISYVQLSLLGYAAVVQHADALAMRRISPDRFTPGYYLHGMPMRRASRRKPISAGRRENTTTQTTNQTTGE